MASAIAHRGPDGCGEHFDSQAGFGLTQRRLAIIDLSPLGLQPMWDFTHRALISFNGEIYNYRELREELQRDGFKFFSRTDTEVILNLYLRDGVAFLNRLNGMFALAIWDKVSHTLLIARDSMGVKPLYHTTTKSGFVFASEIKALCQLPELDRTVDPVMLSQYVTYMYGPSPGTPFRSISKMLPGHAFLLESGRVVKRWSFLKDNRNSVDEGMTVDAAKEGVVHFLSQAVERQMVADVPVGAFLSGGLDSSSLVALARRNVHDRSVECFTIGFKSGSEHREGLVEDLPYATQVADHLGVSLRTVWVGSGVSSEFARMIYHLDEPQADPAPINVSLICALARQMGIKVLLSGAGGDDIFTGYRRHFALAQERWWKWLPKWARTLLRKSGQCLSQESPIGRRYRKAFQFADSAPDQRLAGYFSWLDREHVTRLFSPELRAEVARHDPLQPMLDALMELPKDVDPLNRMLLLEQRFFLADHNLNYTDKMSMAEGVEVRVPFLDPDLMDFAGSLPPRFKQHGSTGKWIFKKAMEPYLPKDVIYRSKTGFGAPLRSWMQHELKELVDDALSESSIKRRGLFDYQAVRHLIAMDRSGNIDASYPIFQLICIETWCKIFLDQRGVL